MEMLKISERQIKQPFKHIKIRAYVDLALAMFISGSAVVVSKMMVSSLPVFLSAELGIFIGMLILLPLTFLIKKETWAFDLKTHVVLFAQALCGIVLYRVFTFEGLSYTTAATSGLITSAAPIIVVLLAYFILKESLSVYQITGTFCVVIGLLMINLYTYFSAASGHASLKGNLLIAAAVLCEALFSILSKSKCKPISPMHRTTLIVCYAFVLLLPFSVYDALSYNFSKMGYTTIFCIVYYGTFVSFLSYVLWFRGIEKVQASNAAVFTSVVPLSSIFLSAVLLEETILPAHLLSLFCIVAGIWLSCRSPIYSAK